MQEVNIFNDKYSMSSGTFFVFKTIGDAIQGTFLGKKTQINKFGNEQVLYKMKVNNGIILVPEMTTTVDKMAVVSPGQIVGFKYKIGRAHV